MLEQSDKKNFILGLTTGVAILAVIGFFVMTGLYLSDRNKSGANDIGVKSGGANSAPSAPAPAAKRNVIAVKDDHIQGSISAPITIIEWSDFQCPYCKQFHGTMKQVKEEYGDKVAWVYRHFPLDSIHPNARQAAEASECAAEQNKFWEYNDILFTNQSSLQSNAAAYLKKAAQDIGLSSSQFDECLDSGKYKNKVQESYLAGQAAGVRGTPGGFLNGQELGGAVPYEQLKAMIENIL